MPKQVVLITNYFPYYLGEQFLETEIKYWTDLVVMPLNKGGAKRELQANIKLDDLFIENKPSKLKILSFIFYKQFYVELLCCKNFKDLKGLLISFLYFLHYKKYLEKYLQSNKGTEFVFYTFWYTDVTYALQSLKRKYDFKLVTRVHRYDLYEFNYMPLRRHFLNNIDTIYTITDSAVQYLVDTYGFSKEIIKTSRLGVEDFGIKNMPNDEHIFQIVSCSFLGKIKRIDKIIDAIACFSKMHKNIEIKWTHIGDGELRNYLEKYAKEKLNISYNFLGNLKNTDVYEFYKNNKVDVFLNVSESEGVPVSIMEAMSCHIPVIAPNVGGIKDMIIDKHNGILMSSNPDIAEISNALNNMEFFKAETTRQNAYEIYHEKYNAKVNYTEFIKEIRECKSSY